MWTGYNDITFAILCPTHPNVAPSSYSTYLGGLLRRKQHTRGETLRYCPIWGKDAKPQLLLNVLACTRFVVTCHIPKCENRKLEELNAEYEATFHTY